MTIPRLLAFTEYWSDAPPISELVAALFAEKKSDSGSGGSKSDDVHDLGELLNMFPQRPSANEQ